MAVKKKYQYKIMYHNDRLQFDNTFKNNFPEFKESIEHYVTLENAYVMVNGIEGDKDQLNFSVIIFKDENKNCIIESKNYNFSPEINGNSLNFIMQAYMYLKTLPEYADAIDC